MEICFDDGFKELSEQQQSALLDELKKIARRYMFKERSGHTLQATALVNEAYVNLAGKEIDVDNKAHFIAIAARQMRRILVDHARKKLTNKRSGKSVLVTISEIADQSDINTVELIYLDKLLTELAAFDKRSAQAFELKLFSELSNNEVASVMNVSHATLERDLKAARAWLKVEMAKLGKG
ncbi:ECF-type sigma factor [Aliiglaciecola sp. M165]|uniref:ECF-type sigma factor n=1 Tax=Aliiglaciecola sp. M165 TaxID=2593649 RepID=UPI00117E3D4B|nr:ECF-type sigma factor [Aliiglaciecola sp. M165]TRY34018.1 sigma-70 family RNA polymerase sigma factor [Aliiglaciecola sp. M165]